MKQIGFRASQSAVDCIFRLAIMRFEMHSSIKGNKVITL